MAERAPWRRLFAQSVGSALEAWPALQVAVENGFGGAYSQQKADWMVTAVAQYLEDNADLDSEEVEELMADIMYNEFDTVVEDGSLSEVAQQIWNFYGLCQRGQESEVRGQMQQLVQRKCSVKVNAVKGKNSCAEPEDSEEEEEEEDGTEAMDCESRPALAAAPGGSPSPQRQMEAPPREAEEEEEELQDGWTVVRRKKK
uniref:pre-rRNA-processing protein TSR2 homolog n=1 Tax=Pristiophorus japonicus TaxID=55135 RepID=UPI00398EE984